MITEAMLEERRHVVRCLVQLQFGRLTEAINALDTTQSQLSRALGDGVGWVAEAIATSLGIPHHRLWDIKPYRKTPGQWWTHLERLLQHRTIHAGRARQRSERGAWSLCSKCGGTAGKPKGSCIVCGQRAGTKR